MNALWLITMFERLVSNIIASDKLNDSEWRSEYIISWFNARERHLQNIESLLLEQKGLASMLNHL
jgi:hypothetical protein